MNTPSVSLQTSAATYFAAFYSYIKNGLQMTKMIGDDEEFEVAMTTAVDHAFYNQKPYSQYHISEYVKNNGTVEKVKETKLSSLRF